MKRFSKWLVENDLNQLAHDFAKMKHDETGKVRKLSGKPYFTHPSNVEGASWDERKKHTMDYLRGLNDDEVLQVVVADKLDNVMDTSMHGGEGIWSKFNAPYEKQKWYYTSLADIFDDKIPSFPLTSRYRDIVNKVFGN